MVGNQTILNPPQEEGNAAGGGGKGGTSSRATEKKPQNFTFDKSYWSAGPRDEPGYCSQQVGFGTDYFIIKMEADGFRFCRRFTKIWGENCLIMRSVASTRVSWPVRLFISSRCPHFWTDIRYIDGQTGSGKSYSMMGCKSQLLIPYRFISSPQ
jgi:hypothetical protein